MYAIYASIQHTFHTFANKIYFHFLTFIFFLLFQRKDENKSIVELLLLHFATLMNGIITTLTYYRLYEKKKKQRISTKFYKNIDNYFKMEYFNLKKIYLHSSVILGSTISIYPKEELFKIRKSIIIIEKFKKIFSPYIIYITYVILYCVVKI